MAVFNHAKREINAKIVYYGAPGSGKASLLRYIHQRIKPSLCGPLKSMPAGGATLEFFDYIPFERSSLDGYQVRFHLYTLTGPVDNPATWKMTLKGVDGLAIVAAAGAEQGAETRQTVQALHAMLASYGMTLHTMPRVLVSSKADCAAGSGAGWPDELDDATPRVRTSTQTGDGVLQALAALSQLVLCQLKEQQDAAMVQETVDVPVAEHTCPADDSELPVAVEPEAVLPILTPDEVSIVRLPVTIRVAGEDRRIVLRMSISVEGDEDGNQCL